MTTRAASSSAEVLSNYSPELGGVGGKAEGVARAKGRNFEPELLTLDLLPGNGKLPADVQELRRKIYVEETRFVPLNEVACSNDEGGLHIILRYQGKLVAAAHTIEADLCDFPEHSGIAPEQLRKCVYVSRQMVEPSWRGTGLSALLIYLEAREWRMRGRETIIAYLTEGDNAAKYVLGMEPMQGVPRRKVRGADDALYDLIAHGQDIAYGAQRVWNKLTPALQGWAADNLVADEAIQTVEKLISTFYDNPWFQKCEARALSRREYLITLGNWHQFVRWTTRLLALAVHITDDSRLRRHYVEHLTGELDHEKWIERDIAHIDGDVEYVTKHMAPVAGIRRFMSLQESMASFHKHPVLFMAIPFSIEGLSGKLPLRFIDALRDNVKSWGYEQPAKGCTFLASHVHTDGAPDGHWIKTQEMIKIYLRTESDLQNFLTIARSVVDSINDAFASFVASPDWSTFAPTR